MTYFADLPGLFQQSLQRPTALTLFFAWLGGVTCSLLPCTVSMLPVLVASMAAIGNQKQSRKFVILQSMMFVLGLASVMSLLGVLTGLLGQTFGFWLGPKLFWIVGGLTVMMALQLLGVWQIPMPVWISKLPENQSASLFAPYFMGVAYGAAGSACGTPFLAAILGLILYQQNWWMGGMSLFFYGLGQGSLLLIVGMASGLMRHLAMARRLGSLIHRLSGFIFLVVGVYFILKGFGITLE
jgi:cytochrome c-type biogenesis protein